MSIFTEKRKNYNKNYNTTDKLGHSEALYHMHGMNDHQLRGQTTGLDDRSRQKTEAGRMKETFRAENAYGNIAVGVNKKKKASVVMNQKKEHNGKTTKESEKNLHRDRQKREHDPAGNFYMNPDLQRDGVISFEADTALSEKKMLARIREYHRKQGSRMMEKRMPYLNLEEERRRRVEIAQQERESREQRGVFSAEIKEKQREKLQRQIVEHEQQERQMNKRISAAWRNARRISQGDDYFQKKRKKEEENKNNYKNVESELV